MDQTFLILIGIVAGVLLGAVSNWVYDLFKASLFPDKPTVKKIFVVVFSALPLILLIALPQITPQKEQDGIRILAATIIANEDQRRSLVATASSIETQQALLAQSDANLSATQSVLATEAANLEVTAQVLATQVVALEVTARQTACGTSNNIKLSIVRTTDTTLWVYVHKCAGTAFLQDGFWYLRVDGERVSGPYYHYAGEMYSRVEINLGDRYVGFHKYDVELYANASPNTPIFTGIVVIEG